MTFAQVGAIFHAMRFLIPFLLVTSAAFAQTAEDPLANFPVEAITNVQQPGVPASPPTPESPPVPASPASPQQPLGQVSELWPANTIPVFVLACTQGNTQLIDPCRCAIESVMKNMTHREFMELSAKNAVDSDARYVNARQQCAIKSQAQRKR